MLVLTRRIVEKIMICENGEISIDMLEIKGSQVRIAIDAPKEIPVYREEIFERIKSESNFENKPD